MHGWMTSVLRASERKEKKIVISCEASERMLRCDDAVGWDGVRGRARERAPWSILVVVRRRSLYSAAAQSSWSMWVRVCGCCGPAPPCHHPTAPPPRLSLSVQVLIDGSRFVHLLTSISFTFSERLFLNTSHTPTQSNQS